MRSPEGMRRPRRRRLTTSEVDNYVAELSAVQTDCIDGRVLSGIVMLLYYAGLDVEEIIKLQIEHVEDKQGRILSRISLNGREYQLPEELREYLREYIHYLKRSTGRRILRKSPLFPDWKNDRKRGTRNPFYDGRTLRRHIKTAIRGPGRYYGLDKIKFGIYI